MVSIRNNITTPPNHVFCAYTPDCSIVMRITNMVTSLMKDAFKINDLASFNVLYDIQHGEPETIKSKKLIYITAVDIYWSQIIFQYSHELCHLLIKEPIPEQFKWFEESICDLASIYFLHESAANWLAFFPDQPDYQGKIRKYIFNLSPGEFFPLKELFDDQSDYSTYMKTHRYDRDKNRYIAYSLFTIFKGTPQLWKSVLFYVAHLMQNLLKTFCTNGEIVPGMKILIKLLTYFLRSKSRSLMLSLIQDPSSLSPSLIQTVTHVYSPPMPSTDANKMHSGALGGVSAFPRKIRFLSTPY